MKATQWIPTAALICSVLTVGGAYAGPGEGGGKAPKKDPAGLFKKMDADGDGRLTLSEFTASAEARRKRFAERRAASGKVEKGENGRPSPAEVFSQMDENGDGVLTLSEFTNGLANLKSGIAQRGGGMTSEGRGTGGGSPTK